MHMSVWVLREAVCAEVYLDIGIFLWTELHTTQTWVSTWLQSVLNFLQNLYTSLNALCLYWIPTSPTVYPLVKSDISGHFSWPNTLHYCQRRDFVTRFHHLLDLIRNFNLKRKKKKSTVTNLATFPAHVSDCFELELALQLTSQLLLCEFRKQVYSCTV